MSSSQQIGAARERRWLRGCERADAGTIQLYGRPSINIYNGTLRIGRRCAIGSFPVTSHFVAGPDALLTIGDDVVIGHGAAIAAFERIEIGAGTQIGPFAIVMDTNFHGSSGDQSVHHDCRPVVIGANCRIGSRVTITRGVTIGDGAEVLAGSVVSSAVPAGACVGGARARILGRAGDPAARWDGAAAQIPLLLMDVMTLSAIPDRETNLSDLPTWTSDAAERLSSAIAAQMGITVDAERLAGLHRLSEVIDFVERQRQPKDVLQ
jgi:acetyltransferase-like isoleucine patch superfamily enzyme